MSAKLTPKQEAFVREYLVDLNATQAAIRAGYSEKTAEQQGYQLLQHPLVSLAVKEAMDKRAERTEITADWVLKGIKDLVQTCLDKNEFTTAMRGYELLGKHHGLFPNKMDVTVKDEISAILESVRRRATPQAERKH